MTPLRLRLLLPASLCLLLAAPGCGDDEPEIDPQERCTPDGQAAYLDGELITGDATHPLSLSTDQGTPGQIANRQIRIELGQAFPPGTDPEVDDTVPMILRLFDADGPLDFPRYIDELTLDEELVLQVYDATDIGPGSTDLTSLEDFDCSIEDGTICAQLGFDTNGDGILHDGDDYVYNAAGGTVTLGGFSSQGGRAFSAHWDLHLGRNIMLHNDSTTGQVAGCMRPGYTPEIDFWELH